MTKQIVAVALVIGLIPGLVFGQIASSASKLDKASLSPQVVERGPDHRVWKIYLVETNSENQIIVRTNTYTELQTGLHYKESEKGEWKESVEEFDIEPGKAVATQGRHAVSIRNNIHTAGSVEMKLPDGQIIRTHPLGLSYYDEVSGQSVLLAEVKDCDGVVVGANQVLFSDAFTTLRADIRYTYTKAGIEQDVILREKPPGPEEWNFPQTTKLEMLTEFLDGPQPKISKGITKNGAKAEDDEDLEWSAMRMGPGKAFELGAEDDLSNAVHVNKHFMIIEGRQILVEDVPWESVCEQLDKLPKPQALLKARENKTKRLTSMSPILPKAPTIHKSDRRMEVAANTKAQDGFVLDYMTVITGSNTNFVFQGDTTYYVSGSFYIQGTTTIEGGTIIKYPRSNPNLPTFICCIGPVICKTAAYHPAVMTGVDDDSVGQTISGSTGLPNPPYGWNYLEVQTSNADLQFMRLNYSRQAVILDQGPYLIRHCQFAKNTIDVMAFSSPGNIENCLFQNSASYNIYGPANLVNCTVRNTSKLFYYFGTNVLGVTNSLLIGVTNWGCSFDSVNNYTNLSANGIFTNVGAGAHYLAANTSFVRGTTNINPDLLAQLCQKTTHSPVVYSNITFSTGITLIPTAARDTNSNPDIGYHYEPIDYIISSLIVSNAALTITSGTVVAYYNGNGILLNNGASISCVGSPKTLNRIVDYQTVQEQPIKIGQFPGAGTGCPINHSTGAVASGLFRFTEFDRLQCAFSGSYGFDLYAPYFNALTVSDCVFRGCASAVNISGPDAPFTVQNNLFERANVSVYSAAAFNNNLFKNCAGIYLSYRGSSSLIVQDNAFDGCGYVGPGGGYLTKVTHDHNAYINTSTNAFPANTNAGDIILTNFSYATGVLGDYYQGSTNLVNAGSANANLLGLYHYTTKSNQVKEADSTVDIGYHYVAVDDNGNPIDSDGNGTPDFMEDPSDVNSDGIPDDWEYNYFGTINVDPNGDYDGDGVSNLQEFQNGTDPNKIQFAIEVANNYVNSFSSTASINVNNGVPSYYSVLVDNTNRAAASWTTYASSNITVKLGYQEGWHDILIGLHGRPVNAEQTWVCQRLKLDLTPPRLVITNPIASTVDVPIIQLQGYCPESLASINYDLSNASGLVTNQQVLVLNQFYDTNTLELTTNNFQAFDVQLTNGVNIITIRASDLAGNITVTNFNIILDYSSKTNPPVVQISWPQNNSKVCGSEFILNGWVSDPTSKIIAQMVDSSGQTNTFKGAISRNGMFQTESIPLSSAPNIISLVVCDAAGNTTTTNITVLQGDLGLSIDPVSINKTRVTGKINSNDYTIWVNGVQGVNKGDGTWSANISPIGFAGGIVQAVAISSADQSQKQSVQAVVQPAIGIYANTYTFRMRREYTAFSAWETHSLDWTAEGGGTQIDANENWESGIFSYFGILNWPVGGGIATGTSCINGNCEPDGAVGYPPIKYEHSVNLTETHNPYGIDYRKYGEKLQIDSQMTLKLVTGGAPGSTDRNLFVISCYYCQIGVFDFGFGPDVPFEKIKIGSLGSLGPDGNLYVMLPDNAPTIDVTPNVPGLDWYSFYFTVQKYHPYITANGVNLETNTPEFCVGQQVTFALEGLPPYVDLVGNWTLPDKFVNEQFAYSSTCTSYRKNYDLLQNTNQASCWFVKGGGCNVSIGASLRFANGQICTFARLGQISVFRPTISAFSPFGNVRIFLSTNSLPDVYLGLADPTSAGGDMEWDLTVNLNTNFPAYIYWEQLIDREWTWDRDLWWGHVSKSDKTGGLFLDNVSPYPNANKILNTGSHNQYPFHFGDGPKQEDALYSFADCPDTFKAYLRFQPIGGIPVVIGRVDWSWHGRTDKVNGMWTLTTNTITGPTLDSSDDSFPVWPDVYRNP